MGLRLICVVDYLNFKLRKGDIVESIDDDSSYAIGNLYKVLAINRSEIFIKDDQGEYSWIEANFFQSIENNKYIERPTPNINIYFNRINKRK